MSKCCDNVRWKYIADASHADGFEFSIGKCESCSANLVSIYSAIGAAVHYEVISEQLMSEILAAKGGGQKKFMRKWYRNL